MDYRSVAAFDARKRGTEINLTSGSALRRMIAALMLVAAMVVLLEHGRSYPTTQRADIATDGRIIR